MILASGQDELFRAHFQMRPGQVRGRAFNNAGTATFDLVEGTCICVTTTDKATQPEVKVISAPTVVVVPSLWTHTFIPLTDGRIFEMVDMRTSDFLANGNTVKIFDLMKPLMEKIQIGIRGGNYGDGFRKVTMAL